MSGRERGAATALIFRMLDTVISAQRDGGTIVDVITRLDADAARAIGVIGEGEITLRLWPCVVPAETDYERARRETA